MIIKITFEEYTGLPCRNQYNDVLAKCHMMNYGFIYVEKTDEYTDVIEIEDIENLKADGEIE